MLRIAQCTDSFLPVKDGVGRVSYEYARALGERGHESYVVTPFVNGGYRAGYPFEIVDFVGVVNTGSAPMRMGVAMMDLHYLARADNLRLDVVHSHSPGAAGMEAARLAEKLRVPLVGTVHPKYFSDLAATAGDGMQPALSAYFLRDYFNRCDELWTVGDDARLVLRDNGFGGNIEVFENGAETSLSTPEEIQSVRETYHLPENMPLLLLMGRPDRMKNLPAILDAMAILRSRGVDCMLAVAGEGQEPQAAKARMLELDLAGRVRFIGHIAHTATLSALYGAASLCLFPLTSNISGGLIVNEAAVQGTPSLVIAGSRGSYRVRDGVNGITCGDHAESIADAVGKYLSDPAAEERMRRAARETLPVPWESVMDQVIERYTELASIDRACLKRKRGLFRRELMQIDRTLEKRTMDLMVKFLRQDNQHLYSYAYHPGKSPRHPMPDPAPLPRRTPEEEGVRSGSLNALLDAINGDSLAMAQSVMVLRNGTVIAEGSWAPYDTRLPHQLYSLSKSVTATAIGMLWDEGLLRLEEKLSDLFSDKMPADPSLPVWEMEIKHLLNMSTGSLFNEVGTALGADWESEFLRAGTKFPVGTAFDYNSMNTYMLAAIVRRKTGLSLTAYLMPRLFAPLGIPEPEWETCPAGTEKGGWGLSLTMESVAKIGLLYLNRGVWTVDGQEKRLLSEDWIDAATHPQIDTPSGEITYGYGHQIWMTAHKGAFLFNGAFGQYMLALPDYRAIVVLFSGTPRLFAQGGVLDYVDACFQEAEENPLPPDAMALEALKHTIAGLNVRSRGEYYDPLRTPMGFDTLTARLDGRVYSFDKNTAGLLPVILMNVSNNYSTGIQRIAFSRERDGRLRVELSEGEALHKLHLSAEGFQHASVRQREDVYETRVWAQPESVGTDEWMLHVNVHFIETPFTRILHFLFRGDGVTLVCDECPTVKDASAMLMELAGLTRAQVFHSIMPLLRQERLQNTLRTFTTVTAQGKL